jgi:lactoylglutathione lyase
MGGDLSVIDELCSPQCVNHDAAPADRVGTEGVKRVVALSRGAMSDQRMTDEMLVAEDDLVVLHGTREATWLAESFRGIPTPKGQRVSVELVHVFRVQGGKIVEHWAVRDDLGLLKQLGVIGA